MQEIPLSLYLKLEQGEHADLAVVSRAAIEFAQVIEEMAAALYPDSLVRIEAVSATEASFGWNSLVKIYENVKAGLLAGAAKHPKIGWLAAYVALRILNNAVDWTQDQVMDWLAGKDAPTEVQHLSENDRRALAADIVAELRRGTAEAPAASLFRELRRDAKIEAAGVSVRPGTKPDIMVSKTNFANTRNQGAEDGQRRVRSQSIDTTLVSPVLMLGDRRWKFRSATGEFGAPVKDQAFLEKVLRGELDIRLQAGLVLSVDLETTEEFLDGAWVIDGRTITKVRGWRNAPEQGDLLAGSGDIEPNEKPD